MSGKQTLSRVCRRTRKDEDYTNYKEGLNAATTEIRQSKRSCEQKLACNIKNVLVKWYDKCLHTGHANLDVNYQMSDTVLGTTIKEKDLGITISDDMKVSEQCGIAASKGNQIIGLIRRNILYKEKS